MSMGYRCFGTREAFIDAGRDVIRGAAGTGQAGAIMLSGGNTPFPVFEAVRDAGISAGTGLHVTFSDERMVPFNSPDSNYGRTIPMIRSLGVADDKVIRVHTELDLRDAADRFHRDLETFLAGGGRIDVGLLGLGMDGHTASLFTLADASSDSPRLAIAVPREGGPDRVSVTSRLLARVGRIIVLVVGPEKSEAVSRLLEHPETIPAGLALQGHPNAEIWRAV